MWSQGKTLLSKRHILAFTKNMFLQFCCILYLLSKQANILLYLTPELRLRFFSFNRYRNRNPNPYKNKNYSFNNHQHPNPSPNPNRSQKISTALDKGLVS